MKTKKPRKQRKMLHQDPPNRRGRRLSAPLSSELKTRLKTNAVTVRLGDSVKVLRGDRKGFEGKVTRVDRKDYRIFIEGVTRDRADGTTTLVPIHPSKAMITSLNLDDKWRKKALERKGTAIETEPARAKPEEKSAKKEGIGELTQAKEDGEA